MESKAILKKAIAASRALAELKGMAERMPNQAMLIDSLVLQEARAQPNAGNRSVRFTRSKRPALSPVEKRPWKQAFGIF